MKERTKTAIIVGAGPAGLTAAYELLTRTDIKPIILEKSGDIGGISKTVNYKGNRIDIGGHRFFSKSDRVMSWWIRLFPVCYAAETEKTEITYRSKTRNIDQYLHSPTEQTEVDTDKVMLVRKRLSRILFLRKFFSYPIQLSFDTIAKLGISKTAAILISYIIARVFPRRSEKTLEDFMINRFGKTLYHLFFKDYTEKVWGVPCQDIPAEWGAQRIKGISISKAIRHAIESAVKPRKDTDVSQKGVETSLIEQFLYPKYGPGQLWEEVARQIQSMGGLIYKEVAVTGIEISQDQVYVTGSRKLQIKPEPDLVLRGDYLFSTMPVKELIEAMGQVVPDPVRQVAAGLQYRDFITVGVLLKDSNGAALITSHHDSRQLKDTWIYVQEKDVTVGRIQLFNNWSPFMVKDPGTTWLGMEFFCNTTDHFWNKSDEQIKAIAVAELEKLGLAVQSDVIDTTVIRMEKTYPAYFGAYAKFDLVKDYVNTFPKLFLVGRNGMHKYNNSDHSMLTAMVAVDNIAAGITDKENIWVINTEQDYHEHKHAATSPSRSTVPGNTTPQHEEDYDGRQAAFSSFVLKEKCSLLLTAVIGMVVQFMLFKTLYPFPDFFSDSYSYLTAAATGQDVNIWPIGYSKFLALVHLLSASDTFLVSLQFAIVGFGGLYFFFTLLYFYRPGVTTSSLLFIFLFFNPLLLYISNYVASDGLFLGLSMVWAAQLMWIIHRPSKHQIWTHGLLLAIAFTVRYNAIYYPIITALAYLFSRHKRWARVAGIVTPLVLIIGFVIYTKEKTYELTGTRQFSIFSGWQLANNALYMFPAIDKKEIRVPDIARQLHQMTVHYFDTISPLNRTKSPVDGAYYISRRGAPLKSMLNAYRAKDVFENETQAWGTVSPVFGAYGKSLILQHPLTFAEHFLLPNAFNYFLPPLEKLKIYNMGMVNVAGIAETWFDYKKGHIRAVSWDAQGRLLLAFPLLFMLLNLIFAGQLVWLMVEGAWSAIPQEVKKGIWLSIALLVVNFGFSVVASPIVFRYQVFPMTIVLAFGIVLCRYVKINTKPSRSKFDKASLETI